MDIREIVSTLVAKYNTRNPFEIAEYRNIEIIHNELKSVLGYYTKYHRVQSIILIAICRNTLRASYVHMNSGTRSVILISTCSGSVRVRFTPRVSLNGRQTYSLSSFFFPTTCCESIQIALCTNSHDLSACRKSLSI